MFDLYVMNSTKTQYCIMGRVSLTLIPLPLSYAFSPVYWLTHDVMNERGGVAMVTTPRPSMHRQSKLNLQLQAVTVELERAYREELLLINTYSSALLTTESWLILITLFVLYWSAPRYWGVDKGIAPKCNLRRRQHQTSMRELWEATKAFDPNYLNKHHFTITRYIIIIAVIFILWYQNSSNGNNPDVNY